MKTRSSVFLVILFTAIISLALAPNINGKWTTSFQTPNGDIQLTFNFKVNGDSLSGNVTSGMGTMPISDGVVNGNKISFDVSFNGNTIKHHGTIQGDSINLQVDGAMGGGDFNMVLKRASENNSQNN